MKKQFVLLFIAGCITGAVVLWLAAPHLPLMREHRVFQSLGIQRPLVIGFLPYWLVNKEDTRDLSALTTLSYFGLVIDTDGHILTKLADNTPEPGYAALHRSAVQTRLAEAKQNNLTLSLVVTSQNEASISALLTDPQHHAENFISDVAPIMKENGFSDLNIDIESFRVASDSARQNFTQFVSTIRSEIDQQRLGTLSMDIAPAEVLQPYIYQPTELSKLVDTMILMAYDYTTFSSVITGPVSPLGGAPSVRNLDVATSVDQALHVIPPEKVALGVQLYGSQYETVTNQPWRPSIPSSGATISQGKVADLLAQCTNCVRTFDPIAQEPYIIAPGSIDGIWQEIFYEDQESFSHKIELVKHNHLAGIALWAIGYERPEMLQPAQAYKDSVTWTQ